MVDLNRLINLFLSGSIAYIFLRNGTTYELLTAGVLLFIAFCIGDCMGSLAEIAKEMKKPKG